MAETLIFSRLSNYKITTLTDSKTRDRPFTPQTKDRPPKMIITRKSKYIVKCLASNS
jgi:hypothetical protein